MMQTTCDYLKRKKYETFRFYEFDLSDSWELSPAEYLRESGNQGSANVKMELPFDMKSVQVFVKNELIYEDLDIPADSPIWICCDCSSSDLYNPENTDIGFTMKCITNQHELREYEYKKIHTMLGKPIGYALKLKRQRFTLRNRLD